MKEKTMSRVIKTIHYTRTCAPCVLRNKGGDVCISDEPEACT
jgi:hypothetical protein